MDNIKGNEIKAADLILQEGLLNDVVSLTSLYGRTLHIEYDFEVLERAGKFLHEHGYVVPEMVNYSNGYKLTDKGREFARSGKSIRDKITKLESEHIKNQTAKVTQVEIDKQDKELERKSWFAAIQGTKYGLWGIILALLGIIITILTLF